MADGWTLGIALYGAVVSTAAFAVAARAHVLGGGMRVKVATSLMPATESKPAALVLNVTNHGRGQARVTRLDLNVPGPHSVTLGVDVQIRGPQLPATIEGESHEVWQVDATDLVGFLRDRSWPFQARGIVYVGTGKSVWEQRYTRLY
jgi:hypothetical protein